MHSLMFTLLRPNERSTKLKNFPLKKAIDSPVSFYKAVVENCESVLSKYDSSFPGDNLSNFNRVFQLGKQITELFQELQLPVEASSVIDHMSHHLWVNTEFFKLSHEGFKNYMTLLFLTETGKCCTTEMHSSIPLLEGDFAPNRITIISELIVKFTRDNLANSDSSKNWNLENIEEFKEYLKKEIQHKCDLCPNHQASLMKGFFLHWRWYSTLYKRYYNFTENPVSGLHLFLELGANPNAMDENGNTLLHHIANAKFQAINLYAGIDQAFDRTRRPVADLVDQRWMNSVVSTTRLLVNQCHLDVTNNDGFTAMDLAREHRQLNSHHETIFQLVQIPSILRLTCLAAHAVPDCLINPLQPSMNSEKPMFIPKKLQELIATHRRGRRNP